MKKTTLISLISMSGLVLGAIAPVTAFAADNRNESTNATATFEENITNPIDPVDPTDPNEPGDGGGTGEVGPLSIDYVSNFNFGTHDVPTADTVYTAEDDTGKNTGKTYPNFVQVSDQRAGDPKGWSLTVSQNGDFKDSESDSLTGAEIILGKATVKTTTNSYPSTNNTVTSATNGASLQPGGATMNVMAAKAGGGAGTWLDVFGTANDSTVKLDVPAAAHPNAASYSTTLTWSLADTPTNS
ncbi:WxL domain-containing protein [Pediococcus ethanolidurans]|uniref:Cell surface protein n=1 Tax=Pediococcus ethanolidurans TaxID=319653 RepID=A0A0R2K136_9LACO|nr:WxL domain-containing protein [Pediococcus ethanolidurans]KRN83083.1 cell surface protein [Pediococcus ethanolidurans]MDV7719147.1 WxL domain-containing protein [Pediococcus ethanolidurans]GEN95068.1 cell surface protein [Pediococcus ethanolidurans]SER35713.1 WxL domain surface cell wall-binding [Pediococcus ethanolidurans]